MLQSEMEKTIKKEFEVKLDDVVHDDTYTGESHHHDANCLKEKVLKGISVEKVYKLKFNHIDEAEIFYNLFAKFTRFSIQKDDLKRDKNEYIISQ